MQRQKIWQGKGERFEVLAETTGPNYEEKFVEALTSYFVEAIGISWGDRVAVKNILECAIGSEVEDLLTQFLHSQLEIIGKSFNLAFGIEAEIETGHAVHAKMSQFVEAVKANYKGRGLIFDLPEETLNQLISTWSEKEKKKLADLLDEVGERL